MKFRVKDYTQYQQETAHKIASTLIEEGVVFGEDLEMFIKDNCQGRNMYTNDEEYLKFEDLVLYYIEKKSSYIVVTNMRNNKEIHYKTAHEVREKLKISLHLYNKFLDSGIAWKGLYLIESGKKVYNLC